MQYYLSTFFDQNTILLSSLSEKGNLILSVNSISLSYFVNKNRGIDIFRINRKEKTLFGRNNSSPENGWWQGKHTLLQES